MTGYQARWDNSPVEAGVLTMFATTIRSIRAIGSQAAVTQLSPASRRDPAGTRAACCASHPCRGSGTDTARASNSHAPSHASLEPLPDSPLTLPDETPIPSEASGPLRRADEPPAGSIEPVLAKPDDWSDLIALAGDGHSTIPAAPLYRATEPPAPEDHGRDGSPSFWPAGLGEIGALEANAAESDPLAALTLEYRQALLSPKSGSTRTLKTAGVDSNSAALPMQHDPFAEPASPSDAESSVLDLLTNGKNVDTLLDSLDAFGSGQIFEADETHEILALLAPHGLSPRHASQAAQLARQEHHLVSVDSHIPMPDSIEHEEPESLDEHDR